MRDWNQPTSVVAANQHASSGWSIEIAVPATELEDNALFTGNSIHFSFAYTDDDDGGSWDHYLEWEGQGNNNATAENYGWVQLGGDLPLHTHGNSITHPNRYTYVACASEESGSTPCCYSSNTRRGSCRVEQHSGDGTKSRYCQVVRLSGAAGTSVGELQLGTSGDVRQ